MAGDTQPDLDEIEACFVAVIEGRLSRDDADRWAARWLLDDALIWGDLELWALNMLFGIDLCRGPDADYLHDGQQVRAWVQELRERRVQCPSPCGCDGRCRPGRSSAAR